MKACPASNEGMTYKSKAKSIFNACYKDSKASKRESDWISERDKSSSQN